MRTPGWPETKAEVFRLPEKDSGVREKAGVVEMSRFFSSELSPEADHPMVGSIQSASIQRTLN